MSVRERILHSRDDDLGTREDALEIGNEGDRSADADVDRRNAPGLGQGLVESRRDRRIHVRLVSGPRLLSRHLDPSAKGRVREEIVDESILRLARVHARDRSHREAEPRVRRNRVRGVGHGAGVKANHRDRGLRPDPGRDVTRAGQLHALDHAGGLTQLIFGPINIGVIGAAQTGHSHVPALVEEGGDKHG